jgi:predicted extracellular nuclease
VCLVTSSPFSFQAEKGITFVLITPQSRRQTASLRRQLLAVVTAAFILFQPALFAPQSNAQRGVRRDPVVGPKISITTLGTPITQNFDTLASSGTPSWADDTTLPGWFAQFGTNATNPTAYTPSTGNSGTGALYSFGVAGTNPVTDRALGSVGSGTPTDIYWALKLTNNTGSTITSLAVSYTGEQWRQGGCTPTPCTPAAQTVDFQYQVANAGVITDANTPTTGWLDQDPLDFTSPQPGTSTAAAIDGNAAANRTALSSTITVTVNNGQEVWLRWKDINHPNNDHGLAIDDFSVTPQGAGATPTPTPTPTLNINDVTQVEGDAGTTNFNFNVSLTSPAGASGVSFTVNTADGTTNPANAGSDYVAISNGAGSITSGNTSTTVTVQVNGDTTPEPNETFFVNITNVTNATAGDTQGLGTITNDDVTLTGICQIQGSGTSSPVVGQSVNTRGIVTGIKAGSSGGFFIQDDACDSDPNTSNGVFVFTGSSVPSAAVVGNNVQVSGTVQEFVFSSDPNSPPITEISGTVTASVLSTGNPLPAPHTITAAETTAASGTTNPLDSLEEFEGMRVTVPSLLVVAPTQGTINEPNATVTSNGVFYGVVNGVARPFREPGVSISDPLPPGSPANVPRFDENPERIRVDSDGQPGTTAVDVNAGAILSNITGPLDYSFRTYTILPDTTIVPGAQPGASPAPTPTANELTVASFNMERFFDTVNDPSTSDPVLTQVAFDKRLDKASRIIRTVQHYPDVIGVEEMENLTTLQSVAAKVNADAQSIDMLPNPNYVAYLSEGNDVGGIDNGFLVKESRVTTVSVTQFNKTETFTNPNTGGQETLNDRPPLVLRATAPRQGEMVGSGTFAFTVIVNHLRSLSGINDDVTVNGTGTEGSRIRAKRKAQAESLANLIQGFQTNDPTERIITVGDMNAFQFNDGYVDVIGTVKGTPSPDDQTVVPGDGADLVNPDLTDLVDTLPASQRYSFSFDGNAQVLDHIIVNQPTLGVVNRFTYARDDADYAVKNYELANELRLSDHDQPIVYLSLSVQQPAGSLVISEFRFRGPGPSQSNSPVARNKVGPHAPLVSTSGGVNVNGASPQEDDEFIEFYNNTDSPITVSTTDGSAGWALVASDGNVRFTIPVGTIIPARGHYLGTNSAGYSLSDYGGTGAGAGDITYTGNIPDGSGIALFRTANPTFFTLDNRLDAAGYTGVAALYREGAGFPIAGSETMGGLQYSLVRKMTRETNGLPKDTGDNLADFIGVNTDGADVAGAQNLGAPGPENLSSPITRNTQFGATLLDPMASASSSPNRVRDLTSDPANNSTFGTMSIRRKFTNNTGGNVTRLRFRIVEVTTFTSPPVSGQADLRARSSNDIVVMVNGSPVDVRGTTVEQPPAQTAGGGWNSSMNVGFITTGAPLANGQTVAVQFLLGVQKSGSFKFFINIEAVAAPPGP